MTLAFSSGSAAACRKGEVCLVEKLLRGAEICSTEASVPGSSIPASMEHVVPFSGCVAPRSISPCSACFPAHSYHRSFSRPSILVTKANPSHHQQRSDEAEIDFEFLSKLYTDPSKADLLLVIHAAPEVSRDHIFQPTTVPFRPDFGYHEYRFDWTPGRITFYTDGKLIWETEKGVPLEAGGLILNHWSNGDPGWSNGPPAQDAHMEFSYVKAYFNTTSDAEYKTRCRDRSKPDAVCKVPDQTSPPEPRKSATFVSPKKGLPEQGGPAPPPPQKVTPDATCGGSNGYTCLGSEHGDCCSSYGFWYVLAPRDL